MRPSSADTSEPAWVKRKMLSTKNSTSCPLVAEVLGHGQAGQADAGAGARRLVHLAVDERAFGACRAAIAGLDDAGLDHFVVEVVAFARALADAGEHRVAAVFLGDVVDQLLDEHGLADAGAAEQADLAALGVWREQVDDLDAGLEDLRLGRLVDKAGAGRWMARGPGALTGPGSSTGSPMTFMMRPSVPGPTGTVIGAPVSRTVWPRTRPSVESMAMRAHRVFAEVLRDFEHQPRAVGSRSRARSGSPADRPRNARRRRRRSPALPVRSNSQPCLAPVPARDP